MQVVVFSLFHFKNASAKWFGFRNMGLGIERYGLPEELEWYKLLGSGGNNGFGLWPNWGGYALLAAFPSYAAALHATNSGLWYSYGKQADREQRLILQPLQAHGLWDGVEPFRIEQDAHYDRESPVAVLTRARIRARHLPAFWKRVHQVSESVEQFPERTFSVGIGEYPVFQQATVSAWTRGRAMEEYAYRSRYHAEVVKMTRQHGWYSEELFCRFKILDAQL